MGSEIEIEQRLKSFLLQLQTEYGILNRVLYKNKNQHRRCSYFQYLLKVQRDMRLLLSARLEENLNSSFQVIHGTRPKQKVQLLESLKSKKCAGGKHDFLEQLLGAARLLSQMTEPILKAAAKLSTLLAQSFFTGFSVVLLALLARLRVLVQQILLDIASAFNMVSSICQKEQAKLTQEGFEVFREYYPKNEQAISLDCVWETDKFVLHERINRIQTKSRDRDTGEVSLGASTIQYRSIEALLGGDESGKVDPSNTSEGLAHIKGDNTSSFEGPVIEMDDGKFIEHSLQVENGSEISLHMSLSSSSNSDPLEANKCGKRNKVAFISVNKPATARSTTNNTGLHIEGSENPSDNKEDPIFSLLTRGIMKDSLF